MASDVAICPSGARSGAAGRRSASAAASLADLVADPVLLLVERLLLQLRDVAAVLARHRPLFAADLTIVLVQGRRLGFAEISVLHLIVDARILVGQAVVD